VDTTEEPFPSCRRGGHNGIVNLDLDAGELNGDVKADARLINAVQVSSVLPRWLNVLLLQERLR
jgi:hypothetical protein